jgi:vacuolar-type H+-ATPase subunit F/Vma7
VRRGAQVAKNIAVIGHSDSIEYFRVLGCETYETENGELTEEKFLEVVERRFKIIFVTEEVFHTYKKLIRRRTQRTFPVVSVIPDVRGAIWTEKGLASEGVGFEELRAAVIRAVGQDIAGLEEG